MLFEVKKTMGRRVARTVPSSGIETWYSLRISSSRASVSSSTRSTSSISSTTGSVERMASSRGRASRNSSEKMSSSSSFHDGPRRPPGAAGAGRPATLGLTGPAGLDTQQLLAVVPLVEGLGLVQPLVALEADEPGAGQLGHRLGQLVLPVPAGPSTRTGLDRRSAR